MDIAESTCAKRSVYSPTAQISFGQIYSHVKTYLLTDRINYNIYPFLMEASLEVQQLHLKVPLFQHC